MHRQHAVRCCKVGLGVCAAPHGHHSLNDTLVVWHSIRWYLRGTGSCEREKIFLSQLDKGWGVVKQWRTTQISSTWLASCLLGFSWYWRVREENSSLLPAVFRGCRKVFWLTCDGATLLWSVLLGKEQERASYETSDSSIKTIIEKTTTTTTTKNPQTKF